MILRLLESARQAGPAIHKIVLDCMDRARDYGTGLEYEIQCLTRFDLVPTDVVQWFEAQGVA